MEKKKNPHYYRKRRVCMERIPWEKKIHDIKVNEIIYY